MEIQELDIRPLSYEDYDSWFRGFNEREASKNEFDDGKLDMSDCDVDWFKMLVNRHQVLMGADAQYIYGIFNAQNENVGMLDVVTLARDHFQWCEIGYFIHNQYWRRGYGYSALNKLLEILRDELKFHRAEAHVKLGNQASMALLEKCGFECEGIRKSFMQEGEEWLDIKVYSYILDKPRGVKE